MSEKVKGYIKDLFTEMNAEVAGMARIPAPSASAIQTIMDYVSSTITAASEGYIVDLYRELSKKTLNEDIFKDPATANKFYELNMRKLISDAYHFDVKCLDTYSTGLDFKEINRVYVSAGVAVGSASVGGILLGALSGIVDIPLVVIIAGAALSGIAGGSVTYAKVVPERNNTNFKNAVVAFMENLEAELLHWVDEVVQFYNQKIDELKASL